MNPDIMMFFINYVNNLMKRFLRKFTKRINDWLDNDLILDIHQSSSMIISPKAGVLKGKISMGKNSTLNIEAGVSLHCELIIGDDSIVRIGINTRISNASFHIQYGELLISGECV